MTAETTKPLRAIGDGGLGFCYGSDRELYKGSGVRNDGPLLVALDTNIVSDLLQHGSDLMNESELRGVGSEGEALELRALGFIVNIWMSRDIRFIPLLASLTDARKGITPERQSERELALTRLAESLAFQTQDWSVFEDIEKAQFERSFEITRADVPGDADRQLVQLASDLGVDVFLTRDKRVLQAGLNPDIAMNIWSPVTLADRLLQHDVQPMFGGNIKHDNCVYAGGLPFGDSGKWVGVLSMFSQREDGDL